MFDSLQVDSGKSLIHQSHKNSVSLKSLSMFCRMAFHKDMLNIYKKNTGTAQPRISDSFKESIIKYQIQISSNDPNLKRYRQHYGVTHDYSNEADGEEDGEDSESDPSELSSDM
jgi:hypothetical protein